jgi:hypothetical protein
VLVLVLLGRIFVPYITARTVGVHIYGQMSMIVTIVNLIWSVLLPGLLLFLIIRLRGLRHKQLEL